MKPEELKYNSTHEWVGMDSDGLAVIGISDFAVEQLTDLVYMDLPEVGAAVKSGEQFGEVESVKAVSTLYSPVDGEVVEVHSALVDELDKLSQDPFGEGWVIKVKLASETAMDDLLDFENYKKQCAEG